eukprot:c2590_g1_i1.p1 GENE.c2590_g1_i1~~c2590_g1_i1.p1  ORF type:complete len:355 (-),score=95.24 c2590_g1_i1:113-1123(-)
MSIFTTSEIKQKYTFSEVIGSGHFGQVRKATNKETGEIVAVKELEMNSATAEDDAKKEMEIMGKLKHPNIVQMFEVYERPAKTFPKKSKKIYIVMELAMGGELFDRIIALKTFREAQARSVVRSTLAALVYMHSHGVVHRDLKPENILYATPAQDSPIKIADFGLAKVYSSENDGDFMHTKCGTPAYVAPEVLKPADKKKGYNEKVDVWSTGVILYVLLCGFPPFYDEDQTNLLRKVVKGEFSFPRPQWDPVSSEAKRFISACLVVDPAVRMSAAEALQHPWMLMDEQHLSTPIETSELKRYVRRLKFKRVKDAIVAVGRMQTAVRQHSSDSPQGN